MVDCIYLDKALLGNVEVINKEIQQSPVTVITLDKPDQVYKRLQMYRNELESLQSIVDGWNLNPLYSCKVMCLDFQEDHFNFKDLIQHAICLP